MGKRFGFAIKKQIIIKLIYNCCIFEFSIFNFHAVMPLAVKVTSIHKKKYYFTQSTQEKLLQMDVNRVIN